MRCVHFPTTAAVLAFTLAGPAIAQQAKPTVPVTTAQETAAAPATAPGLCQAGITKEARNALVALQTAVLAKNAADIALKMAAAKALAKSQDDHCFIALMQVQAAVDANDLSTVAPALETQLASGSVPATRIAGLFENLGKLQYNKGAYGPASAALERAVAIEPGRAGAVIMLAETRVKQNRIPDAFELYRKAIAMEKAAGRVPVQNWYRRALSVANDARSPVAFGFSRDLVAAYPNAQNWGDAARVYRSLSNVESDATIDLYRLQRQTRSLSGEAEYGRYALMLITKGFPGEAKAMLDEGFAAGTVDRNNASIKSLYAEATSKSAGDRRSLDGQAKAALASAAAKPAMVLGEAYYGYGEYAKAAAMFRAALGKAGVDTELANLRLGMALAASGDKAGAASTLALVKGTRADIAQYWALLAATRP